MLHLECEGSSSYNRFQTARERDEFFYVYSRAGNTSLCI